MIDAILDLAYWQSLAPDLHIADAAFMRPDEVRFDAATEARAANGLRSEGYTQLRGLDLGMDCAAMARLARALPEENLDPVFAFVYDEFWRPYYRLDALYRALLGDYAFLPNFWAWNIDHTKSAAGWKPHRDVGASALLADGSAKSLTTWIAASEATPLNGCLYMVPSHADPTYGTAEDHEWRFAQESVRALPAKPGDVLLWNQAVVHWGGTSSPEAAESRVSFSFEVQRLGLPLIEGPAIAPWQNVPFAMRLKLIAKKILHYRHWHGCDPAIAGLAEKLAV